MATRGGRVPAALGLAVGLAVTMAGCGSPPWEEGASTSVTPTPSASPSTTEPVVNDLAEGSLKRNLKAGAASLEVHYWSTLDLGQWTPEVTKPLTVAVVGTLQGGAKGQQIFLTSVRAAGTATGADGTAHELDAVEDNATVSPGYLIRKPNSYQQVLTLPGAPAGSTAMRITLTYQLLIQSEPKADTYLRQAVSDTVQVPLVTVAATSATP